MAVSDAKLLWRANLYIDERDTAEGDWNDAHPWVEGNEWNKEYVFQPGGYDFSDMSTPAEDDEKNGGQVIDIHSFTYSYMRANDNNITNKVTEAGIFLSAIKPPNPISITNESATNFC